MAEFVPSPSVVDKPLEALVERTRARPSLSPSSYGGCADHLPPAGETLVALLFKRWERAAAWRIGPR